MTDWKVGDLAVCVDDAWMEIDDRTDPLPGHFPVAEAVYRVVAAGVDYDLRWLEFGEFPDCGWDQGHFRKVQHDKPEVCETAFTVLLNRSKQKADA